MGRCKNVCSIFKIEIEVLKTNLYIYIYIYSIEQIILGLIFADVFQVNKVGHLLDK
jgi:hypothetical protein